MKKLSNSLGLLLVVSLFGCTDTPIDNQKLDREKQLATRAIADSKDKEYYWSGGEKICLDIDLTQMVVGIDNEKELKTLASISNASEITGKKWRWSM